MSCRFVAVAFLALASVVPVPAALRAQGACLTNDWSPPRLIWRAFNDSAAMHPVSLAATQEQLLIAAEYPPRLPGAPKPRHPATAVALLVDRSTGAVTELRIPDSTMSYEGLRAVFDREGVGHLLWGEIAGETVPDLAGGRGATQVWTARVERGSVTRPTLILADSSMRWENHSQGDVQRDEKGQLHTVVADQTKLTRFPFTHLVFDGSRWQVRHLHTRAIVLPLDATFTLARDTLHAIYTTPDMQRLETLLWGHVWYVRRAVRDTTWSVPVRVSSGRDHFTRYPRIAVSPTGTVHVAWLQTDADRSYTFDTLAVATSTDGGKRFAPPRLFAGQRYMNGMPTAWVDPCNRLHLHVSIGDIGSLTHESRTISFDGTDFVLGEPHAHPYLFLGHAVLSGSLPGPLTRVWSSGFVVPGLPLMQFWYESHQRTGVSPR